MKAAWLAVVIECALMAMAACSPYNGGADSLSSRDGGGSQPHSTDAGACTVAQLSLLRPACVTCVEDQCAPLLASCNAGSCAQCLLGCSACASACLENLSSTDAGQATDAGMPSGPRGDAGVPSGSSSSAPSCDMMRDGKCCSYAALVNLEAECQQAVDSKDEAVCSSLMSQTRNFLGLCK